MARERNTEANDLQKTLGKLEENLSETSGYFTVASCPPMPRPRAHAPNTQGGKPAGQDTSSYNLHSEDLFHPVQNIATSILPLKGLWNNNGVKNLPVEQLALRGKTPNQLYLQSGLSIKARGLGFSPAYKGITQGFQ